MSKKKVERNEALNAVADFNKWSSKYPDWAAMHNMAWDLTIDDEGQPLMLFRNQGSGGEFEKCIISNNWWQTGDYRDYLADRWFLGLKFAVIRWWNKLTNKENGE